MVGVIVSPMVSYLNWLLRASKSKSPSSPATVLEGSGYDYNPIVTVPMPYAPKSPDRVVSGL